ncbi:Hypothetical predicted protein [Lecanosticta acicola]|uniref:RNB domain-containing protein n=1 Tax=Lecanosticta acicola TaxID=111012 RepID=A0AAI8Z3K1_9PEZI|nr:Hypothetical predicted protein [Lecanosticta acicola]
MLASRNAITRQTTNQAYVCLSCRLRSHKRQRHDGGEPARGQTTGETAEQRAGSSAPDSSKGRRRNDMRVVFRSSEPRDGKKGHITECPQFSQLFPRGTGTGTYPPTVHSEFEDTAFPDDAWTGILNNAIDGHLQKAAEAKDFEAEDTMRVRDNRPEGPTTAEQLFSYRPFSSDDWLNEIDQGNLRQRHSVKPSGTNQRCPDSLSSPADSPATSKSGIPEEHTLSTRHPTVEYYDWLTPRKYQSLTVRKFESLGTIPEYRATYELDPSTDHPLSFRKVVVDQRSAAESRSGSADTGEQEARSVEGPGSWSSGKPEPLIEPEQKWPTGVQPGNATMDDLDAATKQRLVSRESGSSAQGHHQLSTSLARSPSKSRSPSPYSEGYLWQRRAASGTSRTGTPHNHGFSSTQARMFHARSGYAQHAVAVAEPDPDIPPPVSHTPDGASGGIRAHLRQWQELHGREDPIVEFSQDSDEVDWDAPVNNLTRLPDENMLRKHEREEEEKAAWERFTDSGKEGFDGSVVDDARFLKMGDLVELENPKSERESVLAVYVQKMQNGEHQSYTIHGRWVHHGQNFVQYCIPGWVSPKLVEPLRKYLPSPDEPDLQAVQDRALVEDMSVPRDVAAPLVSRLVQFYNESQDIYRRHASTLDDAHNILAHETDLRYGSLVFAASTLLKIPSDKVPLTALYTVRKALSNGGFAFNIDRRSHRLTGYMQIRSKDQVRMVEHVRNWLRQWQDDLAKTAGMTAKQLRSHRPTEGANRVHEFIRKARSIVTENRKDRQLTNLGNVSPSKVRLPITPHNDSVRYTLDTQFTEDESEILRFIEGWCCSSMFVGLPRLESLPPLLLQGTGLYDDMDAVGPTIGFIFLQEIGTIMPYENRIRFDQHLLLPSSQHSKPLQKLMFNLLKMRDNHDFSDTMAGLRHDWKDMPVYCIDDAGAQEIDDGISIEPAGVDSDGREQHWVHVHVANPTAFFSRDHPLAKMARHMGETIYMPERTYMMLPRWASHEHFSLANNRPCLTISAKLTAEGELIEHKITPGIIRNTIRLVPSEVEQLVGADTSNRAPQRVYTVGGTPPPLGNRTSSLQSMEKQNVEDLKRLLDLGNKRATMRQAAGGFHLNSGAAKVGVWQSWNFPGLAWDNPYRKGSRKVEGDPIISITTSGLQNWFDNSTTSPGSLMVREAMILASETAATWCAERRIPILYRGTIQDPGEHRTPEAFWAESMAPSKREDGSYPMHLGVQYLQLLGRTALRTDPIGHRPMGLKCYSKATSPLRRYGDMILHWQIEAALREEAETGKSLIASAHEKVNRSFLPFSAPVLDTIILGLQPRELIIQRAKQYSEQFWTAMFFFRKHHYHEDGVLPFGTEENPMHVIIYSPGAIGQVRVAGINLEMNCSVTLTRPDLVGFKEPVMAGDVWAVAIDKVEMYHRMILCRPLRLVGRAGAGIL